MLASRASIASSSLSQWTRGKASLLISFLTLLYYVLTLLSLKESSCFPATKRAERRPASHADVLRGFVTRSCPTNEKSRLLSCLLPFTLSRLLPRARRGFTTYASNGQLPRRLPF